VVALDKPADVSLLRDRTGDPCLWDMLPEMLGGKPYQVHRLDKGTSGVLLVARDAATQKQLTAAFRERSVRKYYVTWVTGALPHGGTVDLPLKKGRKSRYRVAGERRHIRLEDGTWRLAGPTMPGGLPAATRIRPLRAGSARTLLLAQPLTVARASDIGGPSVRPAGRTRPAGAAAAASLSPPGGTGVRHVPRAAARGRLGSVGQLAGVGRRGSGQPRRPQNLPARDLPSA